MPFLQEQNEEEKKLQEQSGGQALGGQSTVLNSTPGATKGPSKSGSFANLQNYLSANQAGAAKMGGDVTGAVEGQATEAQKAQDTLASQKQNVQALDPSAYLANPDVNKASEYQSLKQTGGYTGPNDISEAQGYQDAQTKTNQAQQSVDATKTEGGQKQLLYNQYKRPSYSQGLQKLDQTLVANDAGTKQKFNDINQKYSNLNKMFDTTAQEVGNSINSAKSQATQNKQNLLSAETQAFNDLVNPLKQKATQQQTDNAARVQMIQDQFKNNVYDPEVLAAMGVNVGDSTYGTNLSKYFTPRSAQQFTANDVADSGERQRYQALSKLVGDPTRTEIGESGQNTNAYDFNKEGLQQELAANKAAFDKWNTQDSRSELAQIYAQLSGASNSPVDLTAANLGALQNLTDTRNAASAGWVNSANSNNPWQQYEWNQIRGGLLDRIAQRRGEFGVDNVIGSALNTNPYGGAQYGGAIVGGGLKRIGR